MLSHANLQKQDLGLIFESAPIVLHALPVLCGAGISCELIDQLLVALDGTAVPHCWQVVLKVDELSPAQRADADRIASVFNGVRLCACLDFQVYMPMHWELGLTCHLSAICGSAARALACTTCHANVCAVI